jgi:hypothetical protein
MKDTFQGGVINERRDSCHVAKEYGNGRKETFIL